MRERRQKRAEREGSVCERGKEREREGKVERKRWKERERVRV